MPWFDHLRQFDRTSCDYPGTAYFIASPNFVASAGGTRFITQIVIHITGGPGTTESSAINRFLSRGSASAHYIVNREGQVVQMVRDANIANHIRNVHYLVAQKSIGIEHVNTWLSGNQQRPTETQYRASANLVRWLCSKHGVLRMHASGQYDAGIKGHIEGDPHSHHVACPTPAWDWDHYMRLLLLGSPGAHAAGAQAAATGKVR